MKQEGRRSCGGAGGWEEVEAEFEGDWREGGSHIIEGVQMK